MEQGDGYCDEGTSQTVTPTGVAFYRVEDDSLVSIVRRQAAAIEELTHLVGYLPEAYAVLAKHGLR